MPVGDNLRGDEMLRLETVFFIEIFVNEFLKTYGKDVD